MAITMDGIFVNGQKAKFAPEDILSGDASAYTEEIGTAVEEWLEENVTGGEQVTDTTLTLPGVPADAKVTGDKIDELKEDLSNLKTDVVREYVGPEWEQNRIMSSNGVLVELESTTFANSGFIATDKDLVIEVASGYKIFVWSSLYNELGHSAKEITSAWTADTVNYTYDAAHSHIIVCVQKDPSAVITAEEAQDAVRVYSETDSIFALKTVVFDLDTSLNSLQSYTEKVVLQDKIENNIDYEWSQNRVMMSGAVLTEVESNTFCHTDFILMSENATIEVDPAYKVFGFSVVDDSFGSSAVGFTSEWSTGTVLYTFSASAPYAVICIMKADNTAITPSEAQNAVRFYTTSHSVFALKSVVEALVEEVSENTENVGTLNESVGTVNNKNIVLTASEAWANGSFSATTIGAALAFNTSDAWKHTYFPVEEHHIYNATLYATSTATNKYGAFTDDNLTVLDVPYIGAPEEGLYTFDEIEAPTGATRFYIITYTGYTNVSHVAEIALDDLQSQITDIHFDTVKPFPSNGQILYNGDTKANENHIVNAVAYDDGVIIACRSNGKVVRIGYDGTEETLLSLTGSVMDWRLCYKDSNDNVYVSPHASYGSMSMTDRGLYKLEKGDLQFTKVISLYDTESDVVTETQENDDTIWTMCEDLDGNLYAGVYAHTRRANPAIYKSTDGGDTWTYLFNFKTAEMTANGMHVHSIIFSEWQNALYCIIGEVNTIFKSTNGGSTWTNLNVTLSVKGSAMCATPYGVLIGSDGAYNCEIDILLNDDKTHKTVFSGWANTVFAIRRSDITGFIYAFTKVDSSVNTLAYYPPQSAIDDASEFTAWKNSVAAGVYNTWKAYHDSVIDKYPDDAIRPQHCAILISRDGGIHWDVLIKYELTIKASNNTTQIDGFWTTGFFKNGECLTGRMEGYAFVNPIVISEGKHKYVSGGCDLDGEIFVRTNQSAVVEVIS